MSIPKSFLNRVILPAAGLMTLFCALPAHARVTNVTLSNTSIPYETTGTTGTTVNITIDALSTVEMSVYRLENVSDTPGADNIVASIVQNGLASGTHAIFWDAFWLVGNDRGRKNGNFQVIVTANDGTNETNFVVPQTISLTSLDIHNVNVYTSSDTAQNPALPYYITYDLAKDCLVTVQILNSSGTVVRTLANNAPQFGELIKRNVLIWNGLDNNSRPVPLGIYTITIDARDGVTADAAIQRTRTIAIQSLARLGESPNELFAANAMVYPNPIRNGQGTFQFVSIRNNSNISLKIYTIAGDLVREEKFPDNATGNTITYTWDTTNQGGNKVGRGLYYYVLREEDEEGTLQTVKKLAVIR